MPKKLWGLLYVTLATWGWGFQIICWILSLFCPMHSERSGECWPTWCNAWMCCCAWKLCRAGTSSSTIGYMFLEWCRIEEGLLLISLAALFLYLCVVQTADEVLYLFSSPRWLWYLWKSCKCSWRFTSLWLGGWFYCERTWGMLRLTKVLVFGLLCLQFLVTSLSLLLPFGGSLRLQVHMRFLFFRGWGFWLQPSPMFSSE